MTTPMNCERVETLLGDYIEGTLSSEVRHAVDQHLNHCSDCSTMLAQLHELVTNAARLPLLRPSRDLWPSIENRLGPQLHVHASSTGQHGNGTTSRGRTGFRPAWRTIAAAAALVIVTASITWQVAQNGTTATQMADATSPATSGNGVATANPAIPGSTSVVTAGAPATDAEWEEVAARYVANSADDVEAIYVREIAALRLIVDDQLADLDSATVNEVRRNLEIIDTAIRQSREALLRDPRSGLLSRQLDRALEHKLELLRKVALL